VYIDGDVCVCCVENLSPLIYARTNSAIGRASQHYLSAFRFKVRR
jgi:hypothetical protein